MEVDNNWQCKSILGKGGFGIVELWTNIHTGDKLAIKKCKSGNDLLTERQKERWQEEIKIMNWLRHQNIIATKPVPDEIRRIIGPLPVLCMEYCRGGDLRHILNESENCCGLTEPDVIQIMKDVSNAVEYLHCKHTTISQSITHRDLKPENVVLQWTNNKIIYKLIDLGYAKELGHDSIYASIVGTLNYVAPELLWKHKYSCSVDYWSLGILFFEIITGTRPFFPNESNPVAWRKHIENKSYEDICAQYVDGNVILRKDIPEPTDITPCIRDELVDWFRLVLQWDSKIRGSQLRNGTQKIVVFQKLKQIVSKKVVHIFCVSAYRIISYEINESTNLGDLQSWLEKDTKIAVSNQELIRSTGEVVTENEVSPDMFLTLFNKEGIVIHLPAPDLPALVDKMIMSPKATMSIYELKQCYSAAMFFIKKEVKLLKCYMRALSMKIDLINSRFDTIISKTRVTTLGIESLRAEFQSLRESVKDGVNDCFGIRENELKTILIKLERLSEGVTALGKRCDTFPQIREILRGFIDIDWMSKYDEFLHEVIDEVNRYKTLRMSAEDRPTRMAMRIAEFLKFRQSQLDDPKFTRIGRHISQMATSQAAQDLVKLENIIESFVALTNVYRQQILNLKKKWQNQKGIVSSSCEGETAMDVEGNNDTARSLTSLTNSTDVASDSVIYDNLVIRYMVHDVMSDTYERLLQIRNLSL